MKKATKNANKATLATATKKETAKNQKADLATLEVLKEKVEKSTKERATTTKDKNFIYKFQLDKKVTAKEQKKLRSKLRRNLENICNKIIVANINNKKDLVVCKEFINFYKENYILNDFSLKSLTNTSDETKLNDLKLVLELTKESLKK